VVDEVVHQAILDVGPADVEVLVEVPEALPSVTADRPLLVHVLVNLIDNACKWSPGSEVVRVDALVVNDALHLRVVDRGPGIPVEDRDRVLEPFQRSSVPLVEGRSAGTGLGLAVAAGFCALMEMQLRLEDTPGGGTTATIVMPLALDRVTSDVER
jgi:two-component system sensor histidine kinase KdpD